MRHLFSFVMSSCISLHSIRSTTTSNNDCHCPMRTNENKKYDANARRIFHSHWSGHLNFMECLYAGIANITTLWILTFITEQLRLYIAYNETFCLWFCFMMFHSLHLQSPNKLKRRQKKRKKRVEKNASFAFFCAVNLNYSSTHIFLASHSVKQWKCIKTN